MTYAEKNNEEYFDWNAFLNKKEITQEEWENASEMAASWVTCSCGNQCNLIPRHEVSLEARGKPKDKVLAALGQEFYELILMENIKSSKFILAKIEQRSAYILANL
tara:strand:+ start:498 stop:815 length:318 start_codon:yes stop_codon:yes gene_type:complete